MKTKAKTLRAVPAIAMAAVALVVPARFGGLRANAQEQEATPAPPPKNDYALIFGTVWGKNGRPVYGIPVKIRRADQKKAKWELMSDHQGEFAQRIPVGTADYIVWADIKVPKGAQKPEKTVHIENNERVDISLHLTE